MQPTNSTYKQCFILIILIGSDEFHSQKFVKINFQTKQQLFEMCVCVNVSSYKWYSQSL